MEFSTATQELLISYLLASPDAYTQCAAILKVKYFDDKLRKTFRFVSEHVEQYNSLPSLELVKAQTNVDIKPYPASIVRDHKWFIETIEQFCRYQALEIAILEGVDLLHRGEGAKIEQMVKDALTIKIVSDLGTNFLDDPTDLLARLSDKSNFIKTGWDGLDKKLYGGFTRSSLNIFAGTSGSGKSLWLQNLALNWLDSGLNVVYITLELSEDLVNFRLYSMITGLGTVGVIKDQQASIQRLKEEFAKRRGTLMVKKMSEAGTTTNTIRSYLKEYEIQNCRRPDVLIVDYMDLMYPNSERVDHSNMFNKDKFVSEELRAMASEWDIPVVTASQLNRSATSAVDHDHSHIAGGISKVNTADNVFSIATSKVMSDDGNQEIQFLKTRNSNAVGSRLKFSYDANSMRITDFYKEPVSENVSYVPKSLGPKTFSFIEAANANAIVATGDATGPSNRMMEMLARARKGNQ